ncbi:MAG: DUF433 domain-containing protein [Halobacteria archaeon]
MSQQVRRIVRDGEVRGGDPVIEGTRITLLDIYMLVEENNLNAEEVVNRYPHLDKSDIYRALTYYYDHRDMMEEVKRGRHQAEEKAFEDGSMEKYTDLG